MSDLEYGIINYTEDKLTDVIFGDGRTGISVVSVDQEGIVGVQFRRDELETEPFSNSLESFDIQSEQVNNFEEQPTVRLLFDNEKSINALIAALEDSKSYL